MTDGIALSGEGALWIQPDGPNTAPQYLGCHMLGDVQEPVGDLTLIYCPDPSAPNKFKVVSSFQTTPGPVTTSIETDVLKTQDYLEAVRCPVAIFAHHVSCGKKNVFTNYDRTFLLEKATITSRTLSKLVAKTPEDQDKASQAYEISAQGMLRLFEMSVTRVSISETEDIIDIASCGDDKCSGDCGDTSVAGDTLYLGTGVLAGSPVNTSDLWSTVDGGGAWVINATDPFAAGEVFYVGCLQLNRDTTRIIVVRGTTDAGNPLEIAYSDNGGTSWTYVNVGSTNAQFAHGPQAMLVLDYYHLWIVTDDGYIYNSSDAGATWTAQADGDVTVQDLYAVHFSDDRNGWAAGANNTVLRTVDGGTIWEVIAGPTGQAADTILTIHSFSKNRVWIGYNDGKMYYSHNGGTTWYERAFSGSGVGSVTYINFYDMWVGMMVHNNAGGVGTVFFTIDGGYTWEALSTPTNAGLNKVLMVNPRAAYVVGDTSGGTGVILKVSGG